jgi:hypothetical protein
VGYKGGGINSLIVSVLDSIADLINHPVERYETIAGVESLQRSVTYYDGILPIKADMASIVLPDSEFIKDNRIKKCWYLYTRENAIKDGTSFLKVVMDIPRLGGGFFKDYADNITAQDSISQEIEIIGFK